MMPLPVIEGVIDRRILVNYHVDPEVMAGVLPPPFRPKTVRGQAIAGICLIRLKHIRPKFLPLRLGISSENAAHRIAVVWDEADGQREGVYIPRRDTDSRLNALVGGRLFPGEHHRATFHVDETEDRLAVSLESDDGEVHVSVIARPSVGLPETSVFRSLAEASEFFEAGALGYSATSEQGRFHGLELCVEGWQVTPLSVERVESSFFEEPSVFGEGSVGFDCALLMRGVEHEWHSQADLCCPAVAGA